MIGNDIVDLHFFETPAYHHVHYLKRVCTAEEEAFVSQWHDSCRALAILWAAKEATFKLISKQNPDRRFIHRQFVAQLCNPFVFVAGGRLEIRYEDSRIDTVISQTQRWVHAVAILPEARHIRWAVREIERCSTTGFPAERESQAARFLARELLLESGEKELSLEFVGRVPNVVRKGNHQSRIGISLSHHGAFASAAIALQSDADSPGPQDASHFVEHLTSGEMCSTCTV